MRDPDILGGIFYIVQHSDADVDFQIEMFEKFKKHPVSNNPKIRSDIAFMTDRVGNKKSGQVFGTQAGIYGSVYATYYIKGLEVKQVLKNSQGLKYGALTEKSIKQLNSKRKNYFLEPIEKYYKSKFKKFHKKLYKEYMKQENKDVLMWWESYKHIMKYTSDD